MGDLVEERGTWQRSLEEQKGEIARTRSSPCASGRWTCPPFLQLLAKMLCDFFAIEWHSSERGATAFISTKLNEDYMD